MKEEEIQKVDQILSSVIELSSADKIKSLSRKDESKTLEFKQYFSLDLKTKTKEKYIEESIMKTICGFFNTNGGTLLIGITDRGFISGIDLEIEKFHMSSNDKFLKHFKNKFKERIGEQNYPLIDYDLVSVDDKTVFNITCSFTCERGQSFFTAISFIISNCSLIIFINSFVDNLDIFFNCTKFSKSFKSDEHSNPMFEVSRLIT